MTNNCKKKNVSYLNMSLFLIFQQAFGFFGTIGLGIQTFFHFREWRSKRSGGPHSATSKPAEEGPQGGEY